MVEVGEGARVSQVFPNDSLGLGLTGEVDDDRARDRVGLPGKAHQGGNKPVTSVTKDNNSVDLSSH